MGNTSDLVMHLRLGSSRQAKRGVFLKVRRNVARRNKMAPKFEAPTMAAFHF